MDAKLTAGPWVTLIGDLATLDVCDCDANHCSIGLSIRRYSDGELTVIGFRPDSSEDDYLKVSGICRPADAVAMGAAGDLLEALRELLAVTPATAPAAGLLVGIEDRHRAAINAARAAITRATTLPTLPAGEGGAA